MDYKDDKVTLLLGDCLKRMLEIEEKFVDTQGYEGKYMVQPDLLTSPAIPNIAYDYKQGMFFRIKQEGDTFTIVRRLLPDEGGYIFGTDHYGKVIKRKGSTLAWVLGYNLDVPEGCVVLQLGDSLALSNLRLITKEMYFRIKGAKYNLCIVSNDKPRNLANGIQVIQDERKGTSSIKYRENNRQMKLNGYTYAEALRIRDYLLGEARKLLEEYSC